LIPLNVVADGNVGGGG
jgi:hypothetical protein